LWNSLPSRDSPAEKVAADAKEQRDGKEIQLGGETDEQFFNRRQALIIGHAGMWMETTATIANTRNASMLGIRPGDSTVLDFTTD
jgi:hypothetical protein